MPTIETLALVTLAGLALSASPGPSMLYVLSRSIGQSRAAGLASAIGLGLGGVVLAVATALGLAALFEQSQQAKSILTVVGAAYLIYLGIQTILTWDEGSGEEISLVRVERADFLRIIYQGVLVEVLNPKTILFFLAFLPQFIDSGQGDVALQLLILGILVPLTAVPSDIIVAFVGGSVAQAVNGNRSIKMALAWLGGLFLIGIGVNLFI